MQYYYETAGILVLVSLLVRAIDNRARRSTILRKVCLCDMVLRWCAWRPTMNINDLSLIFPSMFIANFGQHCKMLVKRLFCVFNILAICYFWLKMQYLVEIVSTLNATGFLIRFWVIFLENNGVANRLIFRLKPSVGPNFEPKSKRYFVGLSPSYNRKQA